ncbi:MAG: NlpC/P60 family protein [Pseudomonadota bacterium]
MTRFQLKVVVRARAWLGTRYQHQASLRGVGCDCLGLVRGVWRELIGEEPQSFEPYTPDWGEASGAETLLDAARKHLVMGGDFRDENSRSFRAGDVLIFRMREGAVAKHVGIASGVGTLIHAQERVGVVEVPLTQWWRRRIAAVFQFPGEEH